MQYIELTKIFPRLDDAINYYLKLRYPNGIFCNHCQSDKVYPKSDQRKCYYCNRCHNSFSILKDTPLEKTSTDLRKWMYAYHQYLTQSKIKIIRLQKEIDVTYKTAWRMFNHIKKDIEQLNKTHIIQIEPSHDKKIEIYYSKH